MLDPANRLFIICNPTSGHGRGRDYLARVVRYFHRHGIGVDTGLTTGRGHATELARAAQAQGYRTIVAAGGDGTINEVLAAVAATSTTLGILPWGTGNVFAREAGFPRTLIGQMRVLRQGQTAVLDTAVASGNRFLLMAGAGFDAYSLAQMEKTAFKRVLGLLAYVVGGFRALWRYQYPTIQVELADGRSDQGSFVLVSNTRLYGAFFRFHPDADPTDGLLDVFVYRPRGWGRLLSLMIRLIWQALFPGRIDRWKLFLRQQGAYQTTGVRLTAAALVPLQLDGDFSGHLPVDIQIDPASVRIIVPGRPFRKLQPADKLDR